MATSMSPVPNISFPHPYAALLHALAARAMALTDADGLAIAFDRGDGIVCEASAGVAPEVGTQVGPGSTLSAKCIREATTVTYSREADEHGDAYSTLLAPIILDSRAIGLCAAFANRANAFTNVHLAVLAGTAAAVCRKDSWQSVFGSRAARAEAAEGPAPRAPNAEIVRGLEDQIAEFAVQERRRGRLAIAVKVGVAALLVCGLGVSLAPDRVTAWLAPLVGRVHHSPKQKRQHSADGDRRVLRASSIC